MFNKLRKFYRYYTVDYWKYPLSRGHLTMKIQDVRVIMKIHDPKNEVAKLFDWRETKLVKLIQDEINYRTVRSLLREAMLFYSTKPKHNEEYKFHNRVANTYNVSKK